MQAFARACTSSLRAAPAARVPAVNAAQRWRPSVASRYFSDKSIPESNILGSSPIASTSTSTGPSKSSKDPAQSEANTTALLESLLNPRRSQQQQQQQSTTSASVHPPLPQGGGVTERPLNPFDIPGDLERPSQPSHRAGLFTPYRLHAQCSNNNILLTLTDERGQTVRWVSGGTCKFKNAQRATYEAGYRVSVTMFRAIEELVAKEGRDVELEILFKGRGMGREALQKALLTTEGDFVRPLVKRVTDRTPIKIGGTRAKKARRL